MDIAQLTETVESKEDFVNFLNLLIEDFVNSGQQNWENPNLHRYLEGMEGFVRDSTNKSLHKIDFTPSWKLFAKILLAASVYE